VFTAEGVTTTRDVKIVDSCTSQKIEGTTETTYSNPWTRDRLWEVIIAQLAKNFAPFLIRED
jgi:hypothetical protein